MVFKWSFLLQVVIPAGILRRRCLVRSYQPKKPCFPSNCDWRVSWASISTWKWVYLKISKLVHSVSTFIAKRTLSHITWWKSTSWFHVLNIGSIFCKVSSSRLFLLLSQEMAKQRKCLVWMQLKDDSEIPNPLQTKKFIPQTTLFADRGQSRTSQNNWHRIVIDPGVDGCSRQDTKELPYL